MKYKIKVYQIYEFGHRKDANGQPHQEDSMFPEFSKATDADRLFIVCDGMGGHDAGEVASDTVCRAMSHSILSSAPDPEGPFDDSMVQKAIDAAYDALDACDTGATKKMGTTMTMLKLHKAGATVAHMGDSRVYHIRSGATQEETAVMSKTRDHSLVNDLIAIGELTEEEARTYPRRNVITRAMQPNTERRQKATIGHITDIRPGDFFYMCSDGMLENMDDRQLCYYFSEEAGTVAERVNKLIDATGDNDDNHTAIIMEICDVFDNDVTADDSQPVGRKTMPMQSPTKECVEDAPEVPVDRTKSEAAAPSEEGTPYMKFKPQPSIKPKANRGPAVIAAVVGGIIAAAAVVYLLSSLGNNDKAEQAAEATGTEQTTPQTKRNKIKKQSELTTNEEGARELLGSEDVATEEAGTNEEQVTNMTNRAQETPANTPRDTVKKDTRIRPILVNPVSNGEESTTTEPDSIN